MSARSTMKLHAAVVEDEREAAEELKRFLTEFGQQEGAEFTIFPFDSASQFLRQYQPVYDIVFMDIRMPGMDGMTAAQKLRELDALTVLIFVTNLAQYAVKGYEVDAMDFIVKPIQYPDFRRKMKRVLQAVGMRQRRGIMVNAGGVQQVIPAVDIYYVEVADHNLCYHTAAGNFTVRGKLGVAQQQLPGELFYRCSASHLINLRYVTQVGREDVTVAGQAIRFSRTKRRDLVAAVAAFLGRGV